MADNNMSKEAAAALKIVNDTIKAQESLNKSTKNIADSWKAVASEIFKMDGAQFFQNVRKGSIEIEKMAEKAETLRGEYTSLGGEFDKILNKSSEFKKIQEASVILSDNFKVSSKENASNIEKMFRLENNLSKELKEKLKTEKDIQEIINKNINILNPKEKKQLEDLKKFRDKEKKFQIENNNYLAQAQEDLDDLINKKKEIGLLDQKMVKDVMAQIAAGKEVKDILDTYGEPAREFLALLGDDVNTLKDISKGMSASENEIKNIQKESKEMNKEFSLSKGILESLKSGAAGFGSIIKKDWISSMMKFDSVLNDIQKETGINMDDNSASFAALQTQTAKFGMSIEQAGKMMADMSQELHTTDFSILSKAAMDFSMIEGATGAASGNITEIAGQMMRMGATSEQVHDTFQDTANITKKFGVSAKGVIDGIAKNLGKFKNMGFQGGEKSLAKMVATAQRLNMSIDSAFDMADKARTIEGAMDMAAQLQLAGGSFSNINPMDLLSAARKGPAEMQKILGQMGKDIGKFNAKGEFEIDPIDTDRLRIVAEATGVKLEDLRNGIEKTAMDGQKLAGISEDVFKNAAKGVEGWDADMAKSSLADMMERTKDGKIIMKTESVDLFKQAGITDLKNINETQMDALLKLKDKEKLTMEEQNKRNQSLKQSFDNFINAFMSIFSVFEPVLKGLTIAMQFITSTFTGFSKAIDSLGPLGTIIKWAIPALVLFGTTFGASVLTFVSKGFGGLKDLLSPKNSFLGKVFGKGNIANSPGNNIVQGAGANVASDVNPKQGMDMAKMWETIKDKISKIAGGIKESIGGIFSFIKDITGQILGFVGDVIGQIFDLASGIIDGFTTILQSASKAVTVVQKIVGQLVSIVTKSFISLMSALGEGISAFGTTAAVGFAALTPFIPVIIVLTLAIIGLAFAFKLLAEGLGALAPLITSVFNGIATVVLAVGSAISMVISTIADSIVKMADIDASKLFALAAGLGVLSLAMIAFGAASLVGGVMSIFGGGMFEQISMLAMLAPAIEILATSLNSIADGISKISAAAESLSLEKLERLKALSDSMSNASGSGAAMAEMAKAINSSNKGGGDGEVRKIEINVKMNGRDLQQFIVKDNAIHK